MSQRNTIRAQRPIRLLAVGLTVLGGFQALLGTIFYIASPSRHVSPAVKSSSNTSAVIVQAWAFQTAALTEELSGIGVAVIDEARRLTLPAAIGGGLLTAALGLGVARVSQQSSGTPRHPSNEGMNVLGRNNGDGFPRASQTPGSRDVEGLSAFGSNDGIRIVCPPPSPVLVEAGEISDEEGVRATAENVGIPCVCNRSERQNGVSHGGPSQPPWVCTSKNGGTSSPEGGVSGKEADNEASSSEYEAVIAEVVVVYEDEPSSSENKASLLSQEQSTITTLPDNDTSIYADEPPPLIQSSSPSESELGEMDKETTGQTEEVERAYTG